MKTTFDIVIDYSTRTGPGATFEIARARTAEEAIEIAKRNVRRRHPRRLVFFENIQCKVNPWNAKHQETERALAAARRLRRKAVKLAATD